MCWLTVCKYLSTHTMLTDKDSVAEPGLALISLARVSLAAYIMSRAAPGGCHFVGPPRATQGEIRLRTLTAATALMRRGGRVRSGRSYPQLALVAC